MIYSSIWIFLLKWRQIVLPGWKKQKVQRNFHRRYGRNEEAPTFKTINKCLKDIQERGTLHETKHQRRCTVDSVEIINCFEYEPKQSLRIVANQCDVNTTTVHRNIQSTQHKAFKPQIVQLLYSYDYAFQIAFAEAMLEKICHSSNSLNF